MTPSPKLLAIIMIFFLFTAIPAWASPDESGNEGTGAPYFFVKSDDPETDRLPLKKTNVDVGIAGVIADVRVTQVYTNEGENPLEAVYIFPAGTRAAVYGMKMTIGERTIIADIEERKAAREAYEAAKNAGQSASLLEQQRPNVFQMNVANILPGDVIAVELKYTELLVPKDAIYEFVYPTVVGPRYTGPQGDCQPSAEDWTENPYLHEGEAPTSTLDIKVHLNAGMPVARISCDTHETDVLFDGKTAADIHLKKSEKYGGNRDFILKYRLAGGKINTGLMLYEGENENYFLLMMQPPDKIELAAIPPREYIFIVDVSGSMHGFPLDTSKALLKNLIGNLRSIDRFNVLLFAGGSSVLAEQSLPATKHNINQAIHFIDKQHGGGGTQLLPAMKRALSMGGTAGYSRTLIVATDGYVSVEKETFDLIRNRLRDANMFAFGIGSSVNRFLIHGMARMGMGEPFIVTKPENAGKIANKFRRIIQYPVLTDIEIDYGRFNAYDVEPVAIPDVFADRPVIVFGKWQGGQNGKIRLSGRTGHGTYQQVIDVSETKVDPDSSGLRYLWARHRIAMLADYNKLSPDDEEVKEVTELGLEYNLLTDYTSFVAIDSQKRIKNGESTTTVRQPLPLPKGVSDYAVGGRSAGKHMAMAPMAISSGVLQEQAVTESKDTEKRPVGKDEAAKKQELQIHQFQISSNISKQAVEPIVRSLLPDLEQCLGKTSRGYHGKLTLTLFVDKNGKIVSVGFAKQSNTLPNELKICIQSVVKSRPFPVSASDQAYTINLVLKR